MSDEQHVLMTDARKARQILTNLLTNAVKYTEEGWISLEVEPDEGGVVFRIRDSGIGITPEQMSHIYEPFWQAEPSHTRRRGGTGLGLTVALELTRLLGGRLTAQSEPERGSTFTVWLPDVAPGLSGQPSA
jgi:signal transduction histidine kinase